MEVGKKIKRFRTAFGLSQKELAQKSGLSEPAIRNYELGNRTPSGHVHLSVENKNAVTRTVSKMLSSWNSEFKKLKSGEITKEEYDMWRYSYPRIKAERLHEEFKKLKSNTEK